MFDNIGWFELLILVVVGLFILGPERLPQAAAWLGRAVRQVKDYASGARDQLRSELGPEFDDLRKPLEDLRGIRNFNPRGAMTQHLFDGDNPLDRVNEDIGNGHKQAKPTQQQQPLRAGETPPYDSETT